MPSYWQHVWRPDLRAKTLIGPILFGGYYAFMLGLQPLAPGYIARVWNLRALTVCWFLASPWKSSCLD